MPGLRRSRSSKWRTTALRDSAALICMFLISGCGEGAAKRAVAAALGDSDARFQAMRQHGDYVCGEVHGKPFRQGRGYSRFVFDARADAAFIDPGLGRTQQTMRSTDSACRKPDAYRTVEERLACAAAPDVEREQQQKSAFEHLWRRACS